MSNWQYGDFKGCTALQRITLPPCFTELFGTFALCPSLTTVANMGQVTKFHMNSFYSCKKLESVDLSSAVEIKTNAFLYCQSLKTVDIPSSCIKINTSAFRSCSSLIYVICRATTPPTLGTEAFNDTNNCPIYVPDSTVDTYKAEWVDYADRIRPLSEYTPNN